MKVELVTSLKRQATKILADLHDTPTQRLGLPVVPTKLEKLCHPLHGIPGTVVDSFSLAS